LKKANKMVKKESQGHFLHFGRKIFLKEMKMADDNVGFKKVLNWGEVLALAFSAMIGWGWVILSGEWIQKGGSIGAILGFVVGGILVIFVGLTYAELTVAMPKCGGELVFSMRALGKSGAFLCTWTIILGYVGVVAFEACAFPTVIQYIAPDLLNRGYLYTIAGWDVYIAWIAVGVGLSIVITIMNYIGIKVAAVFNTILTVVIAGVGIMLVAGSAINGDMQTGQPFFSSGFKGILAVAVMTPFMFVGFDVLPQAAEEINIPTKKVGNILILSIVMAVVFYTAIIFAVSRVMTSADLAESSLATADAMTKAFFNINAMSKVLIIGGMSGILTSWNAFFVGGSRAIYAMAEGKMLPGFLGKLHPKYKTPGAAIILIGVISSIAPFFGRRMMVWLTDAGGFGVVVAYLLVSLSFLILRKNEPGMNRPYKVRNGTFVGVVAVALAVAMAVLYVIPFFGTNLIPQEWGIVGAWLVLGVVFGIYAVKKNGKDFGESVNLIQPIGTRNAK
jgi:amino acid transporter